MPEDLDKRGFSCAGQGMLEAFSITSASILRKGWLQTDRSALFGMEHQSAVAYGNGFTNDIWPRLDGHGNQSALRFHIIHESGTSGLATASRLPIRRTCGFTRDGQLISKACTWNTLGQGDAIKYVNATKRGEAICNPLSPSAA